MGTEATQTKSARDALSRITLEMTSRLKMDEVLAAVTRGLIDNFGMELARIWLLMPDRLCPSCVMATWGRPAATHQRSPPSHPAAEAPALRRRLSGVAARSVQLTEGAHQHPLELLKDERNAEEIGFVVSSCCSERLVNAQQQAAEILGERTQACLRDLQVVEENGVTLAMGAWLQRVVCSRMGTSAVEVVSSRRSFFAMGPLRRNWWWERPVRLTVIDRIGGDANAWRSRRATLGNCP